MTPSEKDNLVRFSPGNHPFHEVYFFKVHLLKEKLALWVRFILHSSKSAHPHGQLSAFVYDQKEGLCYGASQKIPLRSVRFENDIFYLQLGSAAIFQSGSHGSLHQKDFELDWDLTFTASERTLRLYPYSFLYWPRFPGQKVLTPNPNAAFRGVIHFQGVAYPVVQAPGCQGHLWGADQPANRVWVHCNTFKEDPTAYFEALSVSTKILGPFYTPPFNLFCFHAFGRDYWFNRPLDWLTNSSHQGLEFWDFEGVSGSCKMVGHLEVSASDFGAARGLSVEAGHEFCHHAEFATLTIEQFTRRRGKWQQNRAFHSKTASYELVCQKLLPPVKLVVS